MNDQTTTQTTTQTISLLAPVNHLPAEGAELEGHATSGSPTPQELLRFYTSVVGEEGGLHFEVSPDGIEPLADSEAVEDEAPILQYMEVRGSGESDAPHIDLASAFATLTLPETDELHLDADATAEEHVRAFLDVLKVSLNDAARGFSGTPVPLVRWQPAEDGPGGDVQCLGVWLANDPEMLRSVAEASSGEMGAIFEESEIEGRGLREMAASLAVVGFFISSMPSAEAGLFFNRKNDEASQASSKSGLFKKKTRKARSTRTAKPREIKAEVNRDVLEQAAKGNTHVLVDISKQRAYVLVNGQVAIDTPISTARSGKHTPRGEFKITQKVRQGKTSTIYGCDLPCWMRLDQSAIGMHVGDLPGYPASAGCVRLPSNIAPLIFEHAPSGTVVKIVDSAQIASVAQL